MDLFATFGNKVVDCFVSPVMHPQAAFVNALTVDLSLWDVIYLFPPTNLILTVLKNLTTIKGTAYLIAPLWPNRPWFGELNLRAQYSRKLNCTLTQSIPEGVDFTPNILQQKLYLWTT